MSMKKLFDRITDEYFYVPNFITNSEGNYRNARVKVPFGEYNFGDCVNLKFDFFEEKIFIDGKELKIGIVPRISNS